MGPRDIPTAPKELIGDDDDLRQMRDALRAGKRVTLASDGKVYISSDAVTPMTEQQEAFVESKLGHVIELARSGYGVTVQPDGTMSAHRADQNSIVLYDPDPKLSEQQQLLIERAISEGAQIRVHSDGRVEYTKFKDSRPPSGEDAAAMRAVLKSEIDSGRLVAAMSGGETLSINPDGSVAYVKTAPGPDPVLFPEDRKLLDTVNASPDDFDAEAKALELGAGAARPLSHEQYLEDERAAATKAGAAGRERAAAEGAAAEADRQAAAARQRANELSNLETDASLKVQAARAAGDAAGAAEAEESAQGIHTQLIAARLEAEQASEAATAARTSAAGHAGRQQQYEAEQAEVRRGAKRYEDVIDAQEEQATQYRKAASELREAQRLEAEIPDLEARGVPGVERVRAAAAEHRRLAQEAAERGNGYDKPMEPLDPAPVSPGSTAPNAPTTGPVTKPPPIHSDFDDVSSIDLKLAPVGADDAALASVTASSIGSDIDDVSFANPAEPEVELEPASFTDVATDDASLFVPDIDVPTHDVPTPETAAFESPEFNADPPADVAFASVEPDVDMGTADDSGDFGDTV